MSRNKIIKQLEFLSFFMFFFFKQKCAFKLSASLVCVVSEEEEKKPQDPNFNNTNKREKNSKTFLII